MGSPAILGRCLDFCRTKGAEQIYLCFEEPQADSSWYQHALGDDVCPLQVGSTGPFIDAVGSSPVLRLDDVRRDRRSAVIVIDQNRFHWIMRLLEPLTDADSFTVPVDPDWVVPGSAKAVSFMDAVYNSSSAAAYLGHSGMRGHYLEFGTFWGASFYYRYYNFHNLLHGRFYGFDSFRGLSSPDPLESALAPDFREGHYSCNAETFTAIGEYLGCDMSRIAAIPGFFSDSLVGKAGEDYGIDPGSVSFCAIDCDILEPTRQVLEFVLDLLEPGALIYFDDWRLCRAHPEIGERGATLAWLAAHPEVDLVEFDRNNWQNQYFIFNRRRHVVVPSEFSAVAARSAPAAGADTSRFAGVAAELKENGLALCKGFFDAAAIHQINQWWDTVKAELANNALGRSSIFVNLIVNGAHSTAPDNVFFNQLYKHPALVNLARSILGEDVCHMMSRLLFKDAQAGDAIQCHQDWPYYSGSPTKLSVMIPVTRHTEANGKLYYVEKSHLYGPIARGVVDLGHYPELRHVGPDLEVGDVFVHDWLTWHYSVPSQDGSDRAIIQIVYQPANDPSSTELVCGQRTNPFFCGAWEDPVGQVDSPWTVIHARRLWQSGVPAQAEKICHGIIAQGDSSQLSCYALLAEMAVAEGRLSDAAAYLDKLKTGRAEIHGMVDELERVISHPAGSPAG